MTTTPQTWTTADGHVIDEAEAERLALAFEADDEAIATALEQPVRRKGRPTLTGTKGRHSPKVEFRVGEDLYEALAVLAEREGRPVSAVVRDAAAAYVLQKQAHS